MNFPHAQGGPEERNQDTVGATRLARATALARSHSNTNMEMFYKHFRLEISTD
jgi:hypothetical protein